MKAAVLYSGGKDSSLMAALLLKLGYEVELLTVNFGVYPSYKHAQESANLLGFPHKVLKAKTSLLDETVTMIWEDGFPNNGINYLHLRALELAASDYEIVSDGIRRDDRVPRLKPNEIQSLEDRHSVQYINLAGWGHHTIDYLVGKLFQLKEEPTSPHNNSDYEIEIRHLLAQIKGKEASESLFPYHIQSRVIGWREDE